jgi:hypothetical protein
MYMYFSWSTEKVQDLLRCNCNRHNPFEAQFSQTDIIEKRISVLKRKEKNITTYPSLVILQRCVECDQ